MSTDQSALRNPRDRFSWPRAQYAISDVEQIINPAAELFAEKGFQHTSMDELAARIGVAKPTLYSYVGSKTAILQAIYDHFLRVGDAIMEAAAAQATAPERLHSVLRNWTKVSVTMPTYYEVYFNQRTALPPDSRAAVREAASKMMRLIRDFVIEGQRKGELTTSLDPTFLTFSVIALTTQTGQWLDPSSGLTWEDAADQAYQMITTGILS
ncbi:MAG TPA: TetR/AcrR family transcriptional regulator [Pseudonocardia sp.]|jgi:AcrR family transcriptional regulator